MRAVSEPNGPANGFDRESSDSSAAGGAGDGEPGGSGAGGFSVSVCLRRVLGEADPRARCLVWVEPERRVRCLLRRLRRLYSPLASAPELYLLVRGHWLPPDEPLALLRPGDQLELVPVEESQLGEETGGRENVNGSESRAVRGAGARPAPGQTRGPGERHGQGDVAGGEGSAELERGKKRALGLLDQYEAEAGVRAPPAARRRRRRRRSVLKRESATAPSPSPAPVPASVSSPASDESRAPRIVRAMSLSPPPVAPSPVTTDDVSEFKIN